MAGKLKTRSTLCDTNDFARRFHTVVPPMSNHIVCHLHQMLQSITAYVCIARYTNGRAQVMQFHQQNGDGVRVMVNLFLCKQACPLPHKNYFVSPDITARVIVSGPRCTCKKHDVECSPACGNCRGSGCSN